MYASGTPRRPQATIRRMNSVVRWFHQLASPPYFDRFAARWAPWCFAAAAVLALTGVADAQNYPWKPTKPITVVVPWGAGGSTDQIFSML